MDRYCTVSCWRLKQRWEWGTELGINEHVLCVQLFAKMNLWWQWYSDQLSTHLLFLPPYTNETALKRSNQDVSEKQLQCPIGWTTNSVVRFLLWDALLTLHCSCLQLMLVCVEEYPISFPSNILATLWQYVIIHLQNKTSGFIASGWMWAAESHLISLFLSLTNRLHLVVNLLYLHWCRRLLIFRFGQWYIYFSRIVMPCLHIVKRFVFIRKIILWSSIVIVPCDLGL